MIYQDEIFPIVHRMKYGPRPSLARFFGELMVREFGPELLGLELNGIIPIPLHPRRLRQRSFNQASLIARRIGKRLDMPVNEGSFIRGRWTAPQVGLSRAKREANVRGAFQVVRADEIRGGRWLLLDDVYTTGSTLKEASRTLRVAGAEAIHVLTLARVL
jgi:ComF family protein